MKKRFTLILVTLLLTGFVFGEGFFDTRFFELKVDGTLDLNNNTIALDDILQKNLVIDLGQVARDMPKSGFNVVGDANIFGGVGLNILGVHAGADLGLEFFTKFSISKGIFQVLGTGNVDDDGNRIPIDVGMNLDMQAFAHIQGEAAFNVGKIRIGVTPAVFAPIAYATTDNSYLKFTNTDDAEFIMDTKVAGLFYFAGDIQNFDANDFIHTLTSNMGFDLGTTVSYKLFDFLDIIGTIRIPMAPGHLCNKYGISYEESVTISANDLMNGNLPSLNPTLTPSNAETVDFKLHRPFKFGVGADFYPLGNFLHLNANLGFGVRNPFSKNGDTYAFFEYYAAGKVNALNIVGLSLSTEYTDEVFKHAVGFFLNLRATEVDVTVSTSSSDFAKSCKGAGIALNLVVYAGF